MGLAPQAHAACTSIKIYDVETKCVEDIVCELVNRVRPTPCVDLS